MKKEADKFKSGIWNEIVAYSATAVASALSMWATIRSYAYRNMREEGLFDDIAGVRDTSVRGLIKFPPNNPAEIAREYLEKRQGFYGTYTKAVDTRYAQIGIRSGRILGSVDKFKWCLNTFEQAKVAVLGLTVCSVMLAGYFNIHHKREIAEQLKRINDDKESARNSPGR